MDSRVVASVAAILALMAAAVPATSEPVTVSAKSTGFMRLAPLAKRFGKLIWRGGVEISSNDERFGGFSGLEISGDGSRIVAVSDQGWWLSLTLVYKDGFLAGVEDGDIAPIRNQAGKRAKKKSKRDSESVAAWDGRKLDGDLVLAFERKVSIRRYAWGRYGGRARPRRLVFPKAIDNARGNKEVETIVRFWEGPARGKLLAVSEENRDKHGNIRAWLWRGADQRELRFAAFEDYAITDMAMVLGGRQLISIERSFGAGRLPGMAVRRFEVDDLGRPGPIKGELLFSGRQPFYLIDNMEGIAVHRTEKGETRATVISDDNYNRSIQRTVLFQFAIAD